MNPSRAIFSVLSLLCAGNAFAAQPHAHTERAPQAAVHEHGEPVVPTAIDPDRVLWTPDAPLRTGLRRMRDAVLSLRHHEMGHLDQNQVLQLAIEVEDGAAFMFANCKLAAEPDIALHGVLARLMAGAQTLRQDPADAAPVESMRAAVEDYPQLFNDPKFLGPEDAPGDGEA